MPDTAKQLLAEARAIFAADPERASELRRRVTKMEISPEWSDAHMDLATHVNGHGDYAAAAAHAATVLAAPADRVNPAARGVAGVVLSDAQEVLEQAVDEDLLRSSIEACVANDCLYYAASGLVQVARLRQLAGDRAIAKASLVRASSLFDKAGSMTGAPDVLLRLAKLGIYDGEHQQAVMHLEQGLVCVREFPLGGRSVRLLETKLLAELAAARLRDLR